MNKNDEKNKRNNSSKTRKNYNLIQLENGNCNGY